VRRARSQSLARTVASRSASDRSGCGSWKTEVPPATVSESASRCCRRTLPVHQHRHARHDEGFYIVSGTAVFTVGDTDYEAPAGTLVMVPSGAPHSFANPGGEPVVMISTVTPDQYVQYFRDLAAMSRTGAMTPQAHIDVTRRYDTEPATEFP
jgi:mannose-6-phosphate isomerase-like protein (cupin superfamily)